MGALASKPPNAIRRIAVVPATDESVAPFGVLISPNITDPGLPIPYYRGSVVEGFPLPFVCSGKPILRLSRIEPRPSTVVWLERHLSVTQVFVGLGAEPFALIVGAPTHERGLDVPDLDAVTALLVPPGHGVMLRAGTWHEFPMAVTVPVTILTFNSEEVVDALSRAVEARPIDDGDVRKVHVEQSLGVRLEIDFGARPAS